MKKSQVLMGDLSEDRFKERCIKKGYRWTKSSEHDDIHKHIDCYVNGHGVDVKTNKKLNWICLEYTNVNGKHGSLRGEAIYLALEINELNQFSIYFREDLLNYVLDNNISLWTKKGTIAVLATVKYNDIKHLEKAKL